MVSLREKKKDSTIITLMPSYFQVEIFSTFDNENVENVKSMFHFRKYFHEMVSWKSQPNIFSCIFSFLLKMEIDNGQTKHARFYNQTSHISQEISKIKASPHWLIF